MAQPGRRRSVGRVQGDHAPLDGSAERGVQQEVVAPDRRRGQAPIGERSVEGVEPSAGELGQRHGPDCGLDARRGHPPAFLHRVGRAFRGYRLQPAVEEVG
jgi:hypothetical protein